MPELQGRGYAEYKDRTKWLEHKKNQKSALRNLGLIYFPNQKQIDY
jgi:hypothetical protein